VTGRHPRLRWRDWFHVLNSDVLGLVSNQQTSKPKPWFGFTKPNHGHGFDLVLVLV
jgi:hypothetical protein